MTRHDTAALAREGRDAYFAHLDEGRPGQAGAMVDAWLSEMEGWADANGCTTYAELVSYARMARPDWLAVLHTHAHACLHMLAYMRDEVMPRA